MVFTTYIFKGMSWRDQQIFRVYFGETCIKSCNSELEALQLCHKLNKVLASS
jgi:hypothetical protein